MQLGWQLLETNGVFKALLSQLQAPSLIPQPPQPSRSPIKTRGEE